MPPLTTEQLKLVNDHLHLCKRYRGEKLSEAYTRLIRAAQCFKGGDFERYANVWIHRGVRTLKRKDPCVSLDMDIPAPIEKEPVEVPSLLKLTPERRQIVEQHLGLVGEPMTFEQIAQERGVTISAVSQTYRRALMDLGKKEPEVELTAARKRVLDIALTHPKASIRQLSREIALAPSYISATLRELIRGGFLLRTDDGYATPTVPAAIS